MSSLPKLNAESIESELKSNNLDWVVVNEDVEKLRKEFKFETFEDAVVFVDKIALVIAEHNHHPDITISYNKVTLTTWDHEANGVTQKDIDLVKSINLSY